MRSMYSRYAVYAIMAAATTLAQIGETGPNNDTTPTSIEDEIVVHEVTVGYFTDAFQPNSINVSPGDKVMFKIYPGNHTVIQSLYGWPCVPRESVDGVQGFFSGVYPNATADQPAVWNYTVRSTETIFYYCGAPGSCINYGMLGVINPTSETNLTGQIDLAKQSKFYLEPNDTLPAAAAASITALAASILSTPSSAPSSTSTSGTGSATPTSAPVATSDGSTGLSAGAIAGIAIGGVAALALIGALVFCLGRRSKRSQNQSPHHSSQHPGPSPGSPPPPSFPRQEMTVDGVTYVPAFNSRASIQKSGFLPPYQPPLKDPRARSPETVSSYSPMGHPSQTQFGSPEMDSQTRFEPHFTFHSPQPRPPPPRHELSAQPVVREEEQQDGAGYESPHLEPRVIS